MYELNEKLKEDTIFLKNLKLSELRLMKDGDLDWFVLVPRIKGVSEITDLSLEEAKTLTEEIYEVSELLKKHAQNVEKINIGMLGNIVRDLHVHIVARKLSDRAWPGPIWGSKMAQDFDEARASFWKAIIN